MTTMWRVTLSLFAVVLASTSLWARPASPQATPASEEPPAPESSAPATDAAGQPSATELPGFVYDPEGRRDPFVSLVGRGAGPGGLSIGGRPAGLSGLGVDEVTLRGTLQSRDGFVAMLQGVDQQTYIVREGDELLDGVVSSISQDDMVILQQVIDPLSLDSQREVRKLLRQAEAN